MLVVRAGVGVWFRPHNLLLAGPLQNQTLHSLLAARGVAREYIFVAQHGNDGPVATVARNLGLRSYQNMDFGEVGDSKVEVSAPLPPFPTLSRTPCRLVPTRRGGSPAPRTLCLHHTCPPTPVSPSLSRYGTPKCGPLELFVAACACLGLRLPLLLTTLPV
jgi:hypothetical protein